MSHRHSQLVAVLSRVLFWVFICNRVGSSSPRARIRSFVGTRSLQVAQHHFACGVWALCVLCLLCRFSCYVRLLTACQLMLAQALAERVGVLSTLGIPVLKWHRRGEDGGASVVVGTRAVPTVSRADRRSDRVPTQRAPHPLSCAAAAAAAAVRSRFTEALTGVFTG